MVGAVVVVVEVVVGGGRERGGRRHLGVAGVRDGGRELLPDDGSAPG